MNSSIVSDIEGAAGGMFGMFMSSTASLSIPLYRPPQTLIQENPTSLPP